MADNVIEFLIKGDSSNAAKAFIGLEEVMGKVNTAFKALTVAAAAFEITKQIGESIELADQFGKLSQRTGIAVENLSQMAHAFALADVSTEDFGHAVQLLNRNIDDARTGNDAATASFRSLGISLADLKTKSPDQILLTLADTFSKSSDGAAKTAAALELFGRAGANMIPALNQGRQGIESLMQQADRLGLTVDKEFSEAAEQFNDSMKVIKESATGAAMRVAKDMLPVLNSTFDALGDIFKTEETANGWGKAFAVVGAVVAGAFVGIVAAAKWAYLAISGTFEAIGTQIGGLMSAIDLVAHGEIKAAGNALRQSFEDASASLDKTDQEMTKVWNAGNAGIQKIVDSLDQTKTKTDAVGSAVEKVNKNPLNFISKETAARLEELRKKQNTYFDDLTRKEAQASQNKIALLDAEYNAEVTKMNQLKLEGEDRVRAQNLLDKWYNEQRENLANQLADQLGATSDAYYAAHEKQIQKDVALMQQAGLSQIEIDRYVHQQQIELDLQQFEARKQMRNDELQHVIEFSQNLMDVGTASIQQWALNIGTINEQVSGIVQNTLTTVTDGIGNAIAQSIVAGKNLHDSLKNVFESVLASAIAALIKMGAQRLLLMALNVSSAAAEGSAQLAAGLSEVFVNSFASAAAIPVVGWAIAPQVATANLALATAGAGAAAATGKGLGMALAGQAHEGMTNIPSEGTFLLDKGERVLSPEQNQDLTSFLDSPNAGGVSIQNLEIHILENASNADALISMSNVEIQRLIADKFIPALNALDRRGVRPNFVQRGAR